ncbi:hypothetical protein [Bosea sp. (in: a-proteobacteria)]|nr:hypothetical protein [Bosea sp. (in: a-proteobacteria)]TAJ26677.1 MAG: hypothetical protein EPO59_24235 [Bosea sp. (in: a-proteobacteria)]SIR18261.1 hypothetical protein SAMN05880592_11176 [Bosea sp. TND4EK4]
MNGRDWALKLNARYPDEDWMAELARRADEPRDKVEWHLQEEMEPPAHIGRAAREMEQASEGPLSKSPMPEGDLNVDDLPFSGVPQFLGKLQKD